MAQIEINALSVITCGSFSVRVFLPEMNLLALDDGGHQQKYPVLWLLHTEGGAAVDLLATPAERCAARYGIFIIAPDQHHSLCTSMRYGPRYEQFMGEELPGICKNSLPISADPAYNWIGGVGTGAYGAVKMALKYPDTFSKAVSLNGILDMEALCAKAVAGEDTSIFHDKNSLEAVFGDLGAFSGSGHDLYALASLPTKSRFLFQWEKNSGLEEENQRLAQLLGNAATTREIGEKSDLDSCQVSLPAAVEWLQHE
jgi:S-formylglutathione hydrolase FrmB